MELQKYSYDIINSLYDKTVNTIKRIQGNKKYISIQSDECDTMYFYSYDESIGDNILVEGEICGLRVFNNNIQFLGTIRNYIDKFDDDDFERASENFDKEELIDDFELCWQNIRDDMYNLLIPTLFSIAEVIEEYEN